VTIRNSHVTDRNPDGTPLGPPANPKATCMVGLAGVPSCRKRATELRAIDDGPAIALCARHARELDEEEDDDE
jgi:hypothetical protein